MEPATPENRGQHFPVPGFPRALFLRGDVVVIGGSTMGTGSFAPGIWFSVIQIPAGGEMVSSSIGASAAQTPIMIVLNWQAAR